MENSSKENVQKFTEVTGEFKDNGEIVQACVEK
jgi:hypothetical protein